MGSSQDQKKILIVEDDNEFGQSLSSLLSSILGIQTHIAVDGIKAMEKLRSTVFDVIISDIKMPKMDGLELLLSTRKMGVEAPFIFISAHADKDIALRALKLGACDFIEKPFRTEELIASIEKTLSNNDESFKSNLSALGLTATQRKIVELLVAGLPNKSIANQLELSEPSIKYHIGNLLERYGVNDRYALRDKVLVLMSKGI